MAEARATAMTVMLLVASSSSDSGDGTTTNVCDAVLPWYAEVVDVKSNNDGNCAPTFNRGNIDGGVANFNNGVQRTCRGWQRWWGEGGNTGSSGGNGGRKRRHGGTGRGE